MVFEDLFGQLDVSRYLGAVSGGTTTSIPQYQLNYVKDNSLAAKKVNEMLGNFIDLGVDQFLVMYDNFYASISDNLDFKGVTTLVGKIGNPDFDARSVTLDTFYKSFGDITGDSNFNLNTGIFDQSKTIYSLDQLNLKDKATLTDSSKTLKINVDSYFKKVFNL